MAQIIGQRTTNQTITETRLPRMVADDIGLLEPDVAPLITLLGLMKKSMAVFTPRYEWFEDDYLARWASNGTATVANTTASTTITVTDGTLFVAGDLFIVPKVVGSSTAPEMVRVVSVSGNALTVIRDVGGAGADTILPSAALRLAGNSHEEGGTLPSAKTTAPVAKITYTQIFKKVIDFTGTQIASRAYGAPSGDRQREHAKKLKEVKQDLNGTLLFGRSSESLSGGPNSKPIRTTQGVISVITTNLMDGGGTLTRKVFEEFARMAFRYGNSPTKILLASPLVVSAINMWASQFLQTKSGENEFGMNVTEIQTGHGRWLMHRDWMLENGVSGQNGFAGTALSLDLDQITRLYLSENGVNRDIQVFEDVVQDGADRKVDQIQGEVGFCVKQEKYHARLFNVSDYQA